MKRFPDNARVLFIGDSITATGTWISHIYDHYLRNFPDSGIRMYNAGISGGSVGSALMYLEDNGLNYQPTHAVIMLGMNDVHRTKYEIDETGAHIEKEAASWLKAITIYEQRMRKLTSILMERGIQLTLVAPTPFDESQNPLALRKIGCDAALEWVAEINRRLALEIHADFVNFHAPMRWMNVMNPFIRADRVHPEAPGHVLMAHLFLAAQGLIEEPTLTTMNALPAPDDLLPVNKARAEAEMAVRRMWNVEWLILQKQPKDAEVRRAFLEAFKPDDEYFEGLRSHYLAHMDEFDALCEKELACVEACAARA